MRDKNNIRWFRNNVRRKLLATVSTAALTMAAAGGVANAADADRPVLWVEMGWHYEGVREANELYLPPFLALVPADFPSPETPQRLLGYDYGADGKISYQPEDSSWIWSATLRYGRAHSNAKAHEQTAPPSVTSFVSVPALHAFNPQVIKPDSAKGLDLRSSNSENHVIVDLEIGKDLGIGILGAGAESELAAGIRFAQFRSRSSAVAFVDPDFYLGLIHSTFTRNVRGNPVTFYVANPIWNWDNYTGEFDSTRSFSGIGPSISWTASKPLAGNLQDGELVVDWGVNAAVLFGRQKTSGQHETTAKHFGSSYPDGVAVYSTGRTHDRSRRVTVPNIGGFAGISYQYTDAKMSLGYRADFFFGAMDGGIDARHDVTRGFYGPYASISIGLGD